MENKVDKDNKTLPTEEKYKDIINLPHPVSIKHQQMSKASRAGQFAPFAALGGFDEEIDESTENAMEKFDK